MGEQYTKLELKPNSDVARDKPTPPEEHRINKVVIGEDAVARKKSTTKSIFGNILANDLRTACNNVIKGVLLPAAIDTLYDFGNGLLNNILYGGEVRRGSGRRPGNQRDRSSVDYHRMSSSNRETSRRPTSRDIYELDDIFLKEYENADKALEALDNLIRDTGYATVADLYDALGWRCEYICNDYGWTKLGRDARIVPVRDGYVIELPDPTYIVDFVRRNRR